MKQQILTASLFVLMVTFGSLVPVNASGLNDAAMSRFLKGEISMGEFRRVSDNSKTSFNYDFNEIDGIRIEFTRSVYQVVEYHSGFVRGTVRGSPVEIWDLQIISGEEGSCVMAFVVDPYSCQAGLTSLLYSALYPSIRWQGSVDDNSLNDN
jgi:hypothetical protein